MQPVPHPTTDAPSAIVTALQGKVTKQVPFWLMRQAGRYLPEYRELRARAGSFLNLCFSPAHAAEVTLQPLRRFDMDAAILFSDILVIPYALGQKLDFVEGEGPRLGPLDVKALRFNIAQLSPVFDAINLVRQQLPAGKALIGFAGAPWTIACYMAQGRGDGVFQAAQDMARNSPGIFAGLIDVLVDSTAQYLSMQAEQGAQVLQLFDSWAGLLPEPAFTRWVIQPTRRIVDLVRQQHPKTPIIGFPRGAAGLYAKYAAETGVDGLGVDQGILLKTVADAVPAYTCLQGNLDPQLLLSGGAALQDGVAKILDAMRDRPFIFNLGHGVIKETPPEHVEMLARAVRDFQR